MQLVISGKHGLEDSLPLADMVLSMFKGGTSWRHGWASLINRDCKYLVNETLILCTICLCFDGRLPKQQTNAFGFYRLEIKSRRTFLNIFPRKANRNLALQPEA